MDTLTSTALMVPDTPERSRQDYTSVDRSRRGSISSSRFSGRRSRRSSVRDEVQTLDEFLRKQRVVRYMQEERERAERTKILREEHDVWVVFRTHERSERLKFLSEHEIAELLQREAHEAEQEKLMAEAASRRAAQEALRRRQDASNLQRDEEAAVARRRSEALVDDALRRVDHEAAERAAAEAEVQSARRISLELRYREEDLTLKCSQLEKALEEAKREAEDAKRAHRGVESGPADGNHRQSLLLMERQLKELSDEVTKLRAENNELRKRLQDAEEARAVGQVTSDQQKRLIDGLKSDLEESLVEGRRLRALLADRDRELQEGKTEKGGADAAGMRKERQLCIDAQRESVACMRQVDELVKRSEADTQKVKEADEREKRARENARRAIEARKAAEEELVRLQNMLDSEKRAREKCESENKGLRRSLDVAKRNELRNERHCEEMAQLQELLRKAESAKQNAEEALLCRQKDLKDAERKLGTDARIPNAKGRLASAGGDEDVHVLKEELLRVNMELEDAKNELHQSRQEMEAVRGDADRELNDMRASCEALKEQYEREIQDLSYTPVDGSRQQPRTPRFVKKELPQAVGVGRKRSARSVHESGESCLDEDVQHLQSLVKSLKGQLAESKEKEKVALEQLRAVPRVDQLFVKEAGTNNSESEDLRINLSHMEEEQDALRKRYNMIYDLHKKSDAARCAAEQEAESLRVQLAQLSDANGLGKCITDCGNPVAAKETNSTSLLMMSELGDSFELLETEPQKKEETCEEVGREVLYVPYTANGSAPKATEEANKTDPSVAPSVSRRGQSDKKKKTKSGCC